ncbi:MAG TPA: magnesium transporter, partial [Dehalococcoidia bacterium]|nr:magnesium transporter [Dehalococcoidia bacterium]
MDESDAEAILLKMDPDEAQEARELLMYEPDTAGGIMVTEYVVYTQDMSVNDVLNDLRTNAEAYSDYGIQYAYVKSEKNTLIWVLLLRDLVLSASQLPIREVMIVNPVSVLDTSPLDDLEQLFDRYMFSGLPVVSADGGLVGVVVRSDMEVAYSERSEKSFMRFAGIVGGAERRTAPV